MSEHRIQGLRSLSAGALPGESLVVYDPVLRIPVDVFPCEDGHAQERSLLNAVLPIVNKKKVNQGIVSPVGITKSDGRNHRTNKCTGHSNAPVI